MPITVVGGTHVTPGSVGGDGGGPFDYNRMLAFMKMLEAGRNAQYLNQQRQESAQKTREEAEKLRKATLSSDFNRQVLDITGIDPAKNPEIMQGMGTAYQAFQAANPAPVQPRPSGFFQRIGENLGLVQKPQAVQPMPSASTSEVQDYIAQGYQAHINSLYNAARNLGMSSGDVAHIVLHGGTMKDIVDFAKTQADLAKTKAETKATAALEGLRGAQTKGEQQKIEQSAAAFPAAQAKAAAETQKAQVEARVAVGSEKADIDKRVADAAQAQSKAENERINALYQERLKQGEVRQQNLTAELTQANINQKPLDAARIQAEIDYHRAQTNVLNVQLDAAKKNNVLKAEYINPKTTEERKVSIAREMMANHAVAHPEAAYNLAKMRDEEVKTLANLAKNVEDNEGRQLEIQNKKDWTAESKVKALQAHEVSNTVYKTQMSLIAGAPSKAPIAITSWGLDNKGNIVSNKVLLPVEDARNMGRLAADATSPLDPNDPRDRNTQVRDKAIAGTKFIMSNYSYAMGPGSRPSDIQDVLNSSAFSKMDPAVKQEIINGAEASRRAGEGTSEVQRERAAGGSDLIGEAARTVFPGPVFKEPLNMPTFQGDILTPPREPGGTGFDVYNPSSGPTIPPSVLPPLEAAPRE